MQAYSGTPHGKLQDRIGSSRTVPPQQLTSTGALLHRQCGPTLRSSKAQPLTPCCRCAATAMATETASVSGRMAELKQEGRHAYAAML